MGLGEGCSATDWASARDDPQNLQNCADDSLAPRHRGQRRCMGGASGAPSPTTRTGAIGGGVGVGGAGAGSTNLGGSGTVRERSIGGRAADAAVFGPARLWPQVTQKRKLPWFTVPQSGHFAAAGATGGGASDLGRKLISGAVGRWRDTGGAGGDGGCAAFPGGASAVAASGDGADSAAGGTPTGGVGGATRGASL